MSGFTQYCQGPLTIVCTGGPGAQAKAYTAGPETRPTVIYTCDGRPSERNRPGGDQAYCSQWTHHCETQAPCRTHHCFGDSAPVRATLSLNCYQQRATFSKTCNFWPTCHVSCGTHTLCGGGQQTCGENLGVTGNHTCRGWPTCHVSCGVQTLCGGGPQTCGA